MLVIKNKLDLRSAILNGRQGQCPSINIQQFKSIPKSEPNPLKYPIIIRSKADLRSILILRNKN